jgi:hypothetical protein
MPLPPMQAAGLHTGGLFWQLFGPVQRTSHAHELPHVTLRHENEPLQSTEHGPGPHFTSRHELPAVHDTLHAAACVQLTPPRHAPSVLHWMSHFQPAGHVIWFVQLVRPQSTVHVFAPGLHDVHGAGHTFASPLFGASTFAASSVFVNTQ